MQRLQFRRRADPELVTELVVGASERRQRLGLAAGAIEGRHVLGDQSFPKWVPGDEQLDLGQYGRVASQRELGPDALLDGGQPERLEPGDLGRQRDHTGQVAKGGSAPLREGLAQHRHPSRRVAEHESVPPLEEVGEPQRVHLGPVDDQLIAGRAVRDPAPTQRPAQVAHVGLQRVARGFGRLVGPEGVDEPVDGYDLVGPEQ